MRDSIAAPVTRTLSRPSPHRRRPRPPPISSITIVPARLTPGFDEHLSNRSLAGVYVALAVGFAAAVQLRGGPSGDRS